MLTPQVNTSQLNISGRSEEIQGRGPMEFHAAPQRDELSARL
jgi:hypothetical protein